MIFAKISNANEYKGICPGLDRALDMLADEAFLASVGSETIQLDGTALYATRFDYATLPEEETFYEAHKRYLDIHMLTKGEERVDIAHPETLEPFRNEGDFYGFTGEAEQTVTLRNDNFLVVFPGDAHRIKMNPAGGPSQVSKVVFKILFREDE